jgi:NUMOD3 motif
VSIITSHLSQLVGYKGIPGRCGSKMTDESKANLGRKHTKEELAKMCNAQKGNKNALGCELSEEFKTF